jgi:hypothetical protein
MTYDLESRDDLGPRVRFFGGSSPKPPRPAEPPPTGPTTAELEAAAKARLLARRRRGRRSTILTGPMGDKALLAPKTAKASLLGGTFAPSAPEPAGSPAEHYGE